MTQTQIALRLGCTKQSVHAVIWNDPRGRSLRIARAISRAVSLPVNTLWPGVYTRRSVPVRRSA